jgi:hypothetical protein
MAVFYLCQADFTRKFNLLAPRLTKNRERPTKKVNTKKEIGMAITAQDLKTLEKISLDLPKAIRARDAEANAKFSQSARLGEKIGIIASKLCYDFTSSANPEIKAKRLVTYCDKTVPVLMRAFGEKTVVAALPPEARNEKVASMSENLGGARIAGLIRKSF